MLALIYGNKNYWWVLISHRSGENIFDKSLFQNTCTFKLQNVCVCIIAQLWLTLCRPVDCSPPGSSAHWNSPGKNTGVGCHAVFHRIFPAQWLNPCPPQCRQIPYHLSHQVNPYYKIDTHKIYILFIILRL